MRKILTRIIAAVVIAALVCGGIYGGLTMYRNSQKKPVAVYSMSEVTMPSDYFLEDSQAYGTVSADRIQSVFVSSTQNVKDVRVEEGQQVKKGDVLLTYDTTLSDIAYEKAEIELAQQELALKKAEDTLEKIKRLVPSSDDEDEDFVDDEEEEEEEEIVTPTPARDDYEAEETGIRISGSGTLEDPYVYLWSPYDALTTEQLLYMFTEDGEMPEGEETYEEDEMDEAVEVDDDPTVTDEDDGADASADHSEDTAGEGTADAEEEYGPDEVDDEPDEEEDMYDDTEEEAGAEEDDDAIEETAGDESIDASDDGEGGIETAKTALILTKIGLLPVDVFAEVLQDPDDTESAAGDQAGDIEAGIEDGVEEGAYVISGPDAVEEGVEETDTDAFYSSLTELVGSEDAELPESGTDGVVESAEEAAPDTTEEPQTYEPVESAVEVVSEAGSAGSDDGVAVEEGVTVEDGGSDWDPGDYDEDVDFGYGEDDTFADVEIGTEDVSGGDDSGFSIDDNSIEDGEAGISEGGIEEAIEADTEFADDAEEVEAGDDAFEDPSEYVEEEVSEDSGTESAEVETADEYVEKVDNELVEGNSLIYIGTDSSSADYSFLNGTPNELYVILEIHQYDNMEAPLLQRFGLHLIRDGHEVAVRLFNPDAVDTENEVDSETDSMSEMVEDGKHPQTTYYDVGDPTFFGEEDEEDEEDVEDDELIDDEEGDDGEDAPSLSDSDIDFSGHYTAEEIEEMRIEQEKEVRDQTLDYKMAVINLREMKAEMSSGEVKSKIDGFVKTLRDPDDAKSNGSAAIVVSGGGGYYVTIAVSELEMDSLQTGQKVEVSSFNNENDVYDSHIETVSTYPTSNSDGWSTGNPYVSYYPCKVIVDGEAEFREGDYVSVKYSNKEQNSGETFYLESMFVRTDAGGRYVYIQGPDGLLAKKYITTGKSPDSYVVEVKSGIGEDDYVAFPYGSNVVEGAETEQASIDDLYSY